MSGTVSQTVFTTRQIIDHAFRRCRVQAQLVTSESLGIATDLLYLLMSELVAKGILLWAIDKQILSLYEGSTEVATPVGTVDVLNLNLRQLQRLTNGNASATSGNADNAFDGDLDTACTQSAPAGSITYAFDSPTSITNLGILPAASGTWDFTISTSDDGVSFTPLYTAEGYAAVAGEWLWIDLYSADTVQAGAALNGINYVKITAGASTTLDVTEFVIANTPSEIPMARINRDDYTSLPDKTMQGRPVQYWLDLQRDRPVLRIWPAVQLQYTFYQLILLRKRYLMDVGTLPQTLDFPQRWYEAIVAELAARLAMEIQEVDVSLVPSLRMAADRAMATAWNGEEDSSPVFFRVNIRPYTA